MTKTERIIKAIESLPEDVFSVRMVMDQAGLPDDLSISKRVSSELNRLSRYGLLRIIDKINNRNWYAKECANLLDAHKVRPRKTPVLMAAKRPHSRSEIPMPPFPLGEVRMEHVAARWFPTEWRDKCARA